MRVYEQWTLNEIQYIVMELLGMNLFEMGYDGNGWASVSEAAQIGIQIVKALEEFHKTGYIHCDLKLDNIMISHEVPKFFVDE